VNGDNGFFAHALEKALIVNNNLCYARFVTQINKENAAVVTDNVNPACKLNGLTDMSFSDFIATVSSVHIYSSNTIHWFAYKMVVKQKIPGTAKMQFPGRVIIKTRGATRY
jgi:hypothetical protein